MSRYVSNSDLPRPFNRTIKAVKVGSGVEIICAPFLLLPALAFGAVLLSNQPADWPMVRVAALFLVACLGIFTLVQFLVYPDWSLLSARNFVFAAVVIIVLSDAIQLIPELAWITPDTGFRVVTYTAIFLASLQIGYALFPTYNMTGILRWLAKPVEARHLLVMVMLAFCIALIPYLFFTGWSVARLLTEAFGPRFASGWSRGTYGDSTILLRSLMFFRMAVPVLATVYWISATRRERRKLIGSVIAFGLAIVILMFEFAQGDRRIFVFLTLSPLLVLNLSGRTIAARRLSLLLSVAAVFIVGTLTEIQADVRGVGISELFAADLPSIGDNRFYVDKNLVHFGRITELVPSTSNYVYFDEILYLVTLPIPRFLLPSKPDNFGLTYAQWIGRRTGSVSYSALAEMYVSFGVLGILAGGIFYGILCRMVDRLLPAVRSSAPVAGVFAFANLILFIGIRSLREISIFGIYLLFLMALILLAQRLSLRR